MVDSCRMNHCEKLYQNSVTAVCVSHLWSFSFPFPFIYDSLHLNISTEVFMLHVHFSFDRILQEYIHCLDHTAQVVQAPTMLLTFHNSIIIDNYN